MSDLALTPAAKLRLLEVAQAGLQMLPPPMRHWPISFIEDAPDYPWCGTGQGFDFSAGAQKALGGGPGFILPSPDNPECLFILLHEVGHGVLGHLERHTSSGRHSPFALELRELAASAFAAHFMEVNGLEVPGSARILAPLLARQQRIAEELFQRDQRV